MQRLGDVNKDPFSASHCTKDIDTFCADVKGKKHGKVQACLREHIHNISEPCQNVQKLNMKLMSEDIRFNRDMNKACAAAVDMFCSKIPKGDQGRVINCLLNHKDDSRVDPKCSETLVKEQKVKSL